MIKNCSVPADIILPHLVYQDVGERQNGLSRHLGSLSTIVAAIPPTLRARKCISAMPGSCSAGRDQRVSPAQIGGGTQSLTIFVEDVDGHFARTKSAGAKIVEELHS
jgi:hypothetical protein